MIIQSIKIHLNLKEKLKKLESCPKAARIIHFFVLKHEKRYISARPSVRIQTLGKQATNQKKIQR